MWYLVNEQGTFCYRLSNRSIINDNVIPAFVFRCSHIFKTKSRDVNRQEES